MTYYILTRLLFLITGIFVGVHFYLVNKSRSKEAGYVSGFISCAITFFLLALIFG